MKTITAMRNSRLFISSFSIIGFSLSLLAMALLLGRVFIDVHPLDRFLVTIFYFTTQSNIIIFIIMTSFLMKKSEKRWFEILAFIGLLDITITGLFFHLFLTQYMNSLGFIQQLLHTIIPIYYLLFYFIFIDDLFHLIDIWILFIHPIIYVVSVYTWIHPIFGPMLERVMVDLEGASYVYPFLDPSIYNQDSTLFFFLNLLLLTLIICVISFILILLKSLLERHIKLI